MWFELREHSDGGPLILVKKNLGHRTKRMFLSFKVDDDKLSGTGKSLFLVFRQVPNICFSPFMLLLL